ncbi:unnamed protein product [Pseudo-nitzschia multistriata]|uniref:Uncharacterized protein n=1 Tax=Pseudo-nitzschia multistriata TaxID=183589 RepID=A0A448ZC39_9STRA|nr:unnamed protein product [Pseudo-nitzschia multistriata]
MADAKDNDPDRGAPRCPLVLDGQATDSEGGRVSAAATGDVAFALAGSAVAGSAAGSANGDFGLGFDRSSSEARGVGGIGTSARTGTRTSSSAGTETNPPALLVRPETMAVAHKLRDRALVLEEERRKLSATLPVLEKLRKRLRTEASGQEKRRRRLLEALDSRNSTELEVCDVREGIDGHHQRAEALEAEEEALIGRLSGLLERRTRATAEKHGPLLADMEAYARVLARAVDCRQEAAEKKKEGLEETRGSLGASLAEEERLGREAAEALGRLAAMQERGGGDRSGEDEQTTVLSGRVRGLIERRSRLRKILKQKRIENNQANEEMLEWEGKRIERATTNPSVRKR